MTRSGRSGDGPVGRRGCPPPGRTGWGSRRPKSIETSNSAASTPVTTPGTTQASKTTSEQAILQQQQNPTSVVNQKQQPQHSGASSGGIISMITDGIAWGTGNAIAHRAVGAIAETFSLSGSTAATTETSTPQTANTSSSSTTTFPGSNNITQTFDTNSLCSFDQQMYEDCIRDSKNEAASCTYLLEQLKHCQAGQVQTIYHQ